jgi:hypothetical protein
VIRTVAALALLVGCGAGEGAAAEALEIQRLYPPSIGARIPDFTLIITGTGFVAGSRVFLGDVELALFGHSSSRVLVAQVRGGTAGTTVPGTLSVSVRNPDGTRSDELPLAVSEAPAPVLSVVSSNLCMGTSLLRVVLDGDNFTADTTAESSGQPVAITHRSRSSLTFSVPRILGHYTFKVTVPPPGGGEASIGYATFLGCD